MLALVSVVLCVAPVTISRPAPELVSRLSLSPFYEKSTSALGIPIVASGKVADAALREAAFIVTKMLGARPELAARLAATKVRLVVMASTEMTTDIPEHADLMPKAYWDRRARGLGATVQRPAISCAEENLLSFPGDPYSTESICVHEFAHVIEEFALQQDAGFAQKLERLFTNARSGPWKGTYAATNVHEYWAEAVQSWFDTNRAHDAEHGDIDTREKLEKADPGLAKLLHASLGEVTWRYQRVANRSDDERALLGALPAPLPKFKWPEATAATPTVITLEAVTKRFEASPKTNQATAFTLTNGGATPLEVFWVDFESEFKPYTVLEAGQHYRQSTYVGHRWVLRRKTGLVGQFVAPAGDAVLTVE